jgi:hypothetical protein
MEAIKSVLENNLYIWLVFFPSCRVARTVEQGEIFALLGSRSLQKSSWRLEIPEVVSPLYTSTPSRFSATKRLMVFFVVISNGSLRK